MFKGFFFNALPVDGQYDRKYNADDYSNALRVVVGNGIVHFNDGQDVQVVCTDYTTSQMLSANATSYGLRIKSGYGWINGKSFNNDVEYAGEVKMYNSSNDESVVTLSNIQLPQKFYKRKDRIIVRRDDRPNVREISPILLKGDEVTEGTPQPIPIDFANDEGTDLCLAEILVDNTGDLPVITVYDKRADTTLCGWVNGYFGDNWEQYCATINEVMEAYITGKTGEFNRWFDEVREDVATVTMIKKISKTYTVATTGTTFPVGIAEYDPTLDNLNVYTNGIYEVESDYTVNSDKTITFNSTKQAGTVIDFVVEKPIDAKFYDNPDETMIDSVESRLTDIYNQLDSIQEFTYMCTGTDDNITISNIVKTFVNANLTDNARLRLNVRGNFGVTRPYQEQQGSAPTHPDNYARWFDLSGGGNRRVLIDFANCSPINISLTNNTANVIFYGSNQEIECCVLKAGSVLNTGTKIRAIYGRGDVHHRECRYSFICDGSSDFTRHGKFDNCEVTLMSKSSNATAFYTDAIGCICEVSQGIYWLYVGKDVDESTYGTKLVYYNRSTDTDQTPDFSEVTILRDVSVPSYTNSSYNGVNYFLVDGQYFKQSGNILKTLTNSGGYIRAKNIIAASGKLATNEVDASTDLISEGNIPKSRGFGQTPFV